MKYRLWNKTTERWVHNDDHRVCEFDSPGQALDALDKVNDVKQLNPTHRNDEIVITPSPPYLT